MEQTKEKQPSKEQLQMTIYSLQNQLSRKIVEFTNLDIEYMKLQQEIQGLKKQLEEQQNQELEEMNQAE